VLKAELDFLLGRYDNIDFRKVIIKNMVRVPPRSSLNKTVNKSLIVLKKKVPFVLQMGPFLFFGNK
jgi:hypothetical protein